MSTEGKGTTELYASQVANNIVYNRFNLPTWLSHETCCSVYLAIAAAIVEAIEKGRQDASRRQSDGDA